MNKGVGKKRWDKIVAAVLVVVERRKKYDGKR